MIGLIENDTLYDYDIRTLLQAFFANEKIVPKREGTRMVLTVHFKDLGPHTILLETPEKTEYMRTIYGNYKNKMELRNEVKEAVYAILKEYTKHPLPWGTLTGIRPVKIITRLLEEGMTEEEAKRKFQRDYLTTEQKADLSTRVAVKEQQILSSLDYENQYSLYIGIPFCPSTCLYCSFTSYPIAVYKDMVEDYLKALFLEIDFAAEQFRDRHLISVYIGGGTPTSLNAEQLKRLIQKIRVSFDLSYLKEFTVEAGRPDSITRDKLQVLHDLQVGRISINPQTMQEKTLKMIGRAHTVKQVYEAFQLAREIGFHSINMDIIAGLVGEDLADVKDTLAQIKQLAPDNLTVHSLAIKRAADLNIHREQYEGMVKGSTNAMLEEADRVAASMGLQPYYLYRQKNIPGNLENIGYALPGKEGLYNILIMEEKQTILALGAGASSKYIFPEEDRIERTENVKDVKLYIARIEEMIDRKRKMLARYQ